MVVIEMENGGIMELELYPDIAPITVSNFEKLVKSGFYDGLCFHRVIEGFMIQGGDPNGNGTGGPGWHIKGEFAANGVKNDLKHTRGVISMARSSNPDSAGSQFFIMHDDAPHLDGQYAAFGKLVKGYDVLDEIASVRTGFRDDPKHPQIMKKVYIKEDDEKADKEEKPEEAGEEKPADPVPGGYYVTENCICCQNCLDYCPTGAIEIGDDRAVINQEICIRCGSCADSCPAEAIITK